LALIKATHDFDETPPIAEHVLLHLRHGGDKSDSHIMFKEGNKAIAYAHLILQLLKLLKCWRISTDPRDGDGSSHCSPFKHGFKP